MFFTVFFVLSILAMIIGSLFLINKDTRDGGIITTIIGGGVLLLFLAFNVWTTVDAGHTKVAKLFGKPVNEYQAGFHFVNPFYSMVDYDGRVQEYTRSGRENEGAESGYDAINATTKNNMEVYIEETIKWRLPEGNFTSILQNVGDFDDVVYKYVRPDISEITNSVVAKFEGNTIIENRDSVTFLIHRELLNKWNTDKFVELVSVNVRDIDLPPKFKEAVEEKLASKEKVTTAKNLATAKGFEGEAVLNYQKKIAEAQKLGKESSAQALEWKRLDVLEKLVDNDSISWGIVQMNENGTPLFINPNIK